MLYTITYGTPPTSTSVEKNSATLALAEALRLRAQGHRNIEVSGPDGSPLTLDDLEDLVRGASAIKRGDDRH